MGTFSVRIEVGGISGSQFVQFEALVDTGSTYTVLPKETLDRLRLNGDQTIVLVVFGPEGIAPLLGATALEHLSLAVDPIHQRLVPVNALLK